MKFKAIIEKKIEVAELGVIVPGQEFEVSNENLLKIFQDTTLFEEVKEQKKKAAKKVAKKDDCPGCPDAKK